MLRVGTLSLRTPPRRRRRRRLVASRSGPSGKLSLVLPSSASRTPKSTKATRATNCNVSSSRSSPSHGGLCWCALSLSLSLTLSNSLSTSKLCLRSFWALALTTLATLALRTSRAQLSVQPPAPASAPCFWPTCKKLPPVKDMHLGDYLGDFFGRGKLRNKGERNVTSNQRSNPPSEPQLLSMSTTNVERTRDQRAGCKLCVLVRRFSLRDCSLSLSLSLSLSTLKERARSSYALTFRSRPPAKNADI